LLGFPYYNYALYLGYLDIVLLLFIGLSTVFWFLEEEHRRLDEATRKIQHMAYHDPLTGLPNRDLLLDRLTKAVEQAFRERKKVAVYYLDIDRFKVINNTLGYAFGDELLRVVSDRLKNMVQRGDTIAKLGGDEFVITLTNISTTEEALEYAENISASIRSPFYHQNRELFLNTTIGVSIFNDHGYWAEDLIDAAQSALIFGKENARGEIVLYDPLMRVEDSTRMSIEGDLRKALPSNQLILHYQPIVNLKSGLISGVEALIRWEHPVMGLLYPADFLRMAETIGVGDNINLWSMYEASSQLSKWRLLGFKNLFVTVNLVARLFQNPELINEIKKMLLDAAIPPEFFHIEVTENIAIQNPEVSIDVLNQLKNLGLRLSIDDFGTGYSSLSYLRLLPIHFLKIDRSFIQNLPFDSITVSILEAILTMAHSMELKVVAEGVETEEQAKLLAKKGCDFMQGYYFSKAVGPADFLKLLENQNAKGDFYSGFEKKKTLLT